MNRVIIFKNSMFISLIFMLAFVMSENTVLSNVILKSLLVKCTSNTEEIKGEFIESNSHNFGFDDYTEWKPVTTTYYNNPRLPGEKCATPYASVAAGYPGCVYFKLEHSPISDSIDFSVEKPQLQYLPYSTQYSRSVGFMPPINWFDSSYLFAKRKFQNIAKLMVKSYKRKSITVGIRLVHDIHYTSTDIDTNEIQSTLTKVYKQACIDVDVTRLSPVQIWFDENDDGMIDIVAQDDNTWTSSEMQTIIENGINEVEAESYNYIIFIVSNASDSTKWGRMYFSQKYGFVFTGGGANTQVVAHELGHGLGLHHVIDLGVDHDRDNLMNHNAATEHIKLRYNQWNTLNNILDN